MIISTGASARMLGLDSEARLLGHGLSTCATCDGFFFRGQEIAVVGGGDSAIEEATFLTRFATKVSVIHRRDELRASKIMQERAFANPKISFVWNSVVDDVVGAEKVEGLALRNIVTGETSELKVGGVFVAIGHDPNTSLFTGQIDLDAGRLRRHPRRLQDLGAGRLRLRRRTGPRVPPGDHRRRLGLHGGHRRRAVSGGRRPSLELGISVVQTVFQMSTTVERITRCPPSSP